MVMSGILIIPEIIFNGGNTCKAIDMHIVVSEQASCCISVHCKYGINLIFADSIIPV